MYIFCIFDILHCCSWQDKNCEYICLPPFPKGPGQRVWRFFICGVMTGADYCRMLHCTIGHMPVRSVDGALPDFDDGTKALDFFAGIGQHKYIFDIFDTFYLFFILYRSCDSCLLCMRKTLPIYWFETISWYIVALVLQRVLPKFLPRTPADVEELLSCKFRV